MNQEKIAVIDFSSEYSTTINIEENGESKEIFISEPSSQTHDTVISIFQQLGFNTSVK